jgi:hypothetical protein
MKTDNQGEDWADGRYVGTIRPRSRFWMRDEYRQRLTPLLGEILGDDEVLDTARQLAVSVQSLPSDNVPEIDKKWAGLAVHEKADLPVAFQRIIDDLLPKIPVELRTWESPSLIRLQTVIDAARNLNDYLGNNILDGELRRARQVFDDATQRRYELGGFK